MSLPDTSYPTVPRIEHPGPPTPHRVDPHPTTLHRISAQLPTGAALLPALRELIFDRGFTSAYGELRGGVLKAFDYYIPSVCTAGTHAATFSDALTGQAPAQFIRGGVTIGRRDGAVFAHCHAVFVGADGVLRAGHLIPDSVRLGPGVGADLYATDDVEMTVTPDPEINLPVFQPHPTGTTTAPRGGGLRAVVARIHPNVDLVAAVEHLAEVHHLDNAVIRGQIGSLVGATLTQGGQIVTAPGPATEVMYLDGSIARTPDGHTRAELSCAAVDLNGTIYSGTLVPGHNPVAMTFELALSEPVRTTP